MHFSRWIKSLRCSKIDHLDHCIVRFGIEEEVFRFEIAMHDFHRVAVGYGRQHLLHDHSRISLAVIRPFDDLVKQFTTTAVFCDNEVALGILIDLEETHDVGMIHIFQNLDLLKEPSFFFALEEALLDDLYSSFSPGFSVGAEADLTECPGSKDFSNQVIISDIIGAMNRHERLLTESDFITPAFRSIRTCRKRLSWGNPIALGVISSPTAFRRHT